MISFFYIVVFAVVIFSFVTNLKKENKKGQKSRKKNQEAVQKAQKKKIHEHSEQAKARGDASGALEEELKNASRSGTLKITREIPEPGYCILNGKKRKLSDLKDY